MTVLVAVDGHSLNLGLQKVAQNRKDGNSRFRIDHELLAEFLLEQAGVDLETKVADWPLRFYTDNQKVTDEDSRIMGKVVKYFGAKGYGFIAATDGNSYFFHNNEVLNKRALCDANEDRYPHPTSRDFQSRILNKVVTFDPAQNDDGRSKAEEVRLEFGSRALDRFYRLRREPFLEMLEDSGYQVVRCRPSKTSGKAKSIDCKIYLDALCDLEEEDRLVLLSDDPVFCELVIKLASFKIKVILATFDTAHSEELRDAVKNSGGQTVLLDEHLNELELAYEEEEASEESEALASA